MVILINSSDHICDRFLNLSNRDQSEDLLYSSLEHLFFRAILPCIVVIGVLANVAFIFVVFRVKEMQTITNTYLVNIAVADLIFVGFSGGFYIAIYLNSTPIRNAIKYKSGMGCLAPWLVTYMTYLCSLLLITIVTADKFFAICYPLKHRQITGKSWMQKIISFCWVFGIVLGVPIAFDYSGLEYVCVIWPQDKEFDKFPSIIKFCKALHPSLSILNDVLEVTSFLVILVANLYMYGHIIMALTNRPSSAPNDNSDINTAQSRQVLRVRNQVARLLIINGVVFFCCQGPYRMISVHSFWNAVTGYKIFSDGQYGMLAVMSRSLILWNSCCNTFIYYGSSSYYRSGFRKAFCGPKQQDDNMINTVSTAI